MTSELGLGTALAEAQTRAANGRAAPMVSPTSEDKIRAVLRSLALAHGLKPEAVIADFDAGGALAALARAIVGAKPARGRGRPRKQVETWNTYTAVVTWTRAGLTLEAAIARVAENAEMPEATVRSQYDRTRIRDGVDPQAVPQSRIAAAFADPRD